VSNPSIAKTDFMIVARMLRKDVESVEDGCMLLANLKEPCLLILDNADDPNFDYRVYFPSAMQGCIIMTSRVADCKHFATVGSEALTSLKREECQELLFKAASIPKDDWKVHVEAADDILFLVGSHTLALIQAGAFVARGHCHFNDYPRVFRQHRRRLLEFRPSQAKSRYGDVYATFEASAEVLSEDALQLLGIISILHFSFLDIGIFESAWVGSKRASCITYESEARLGDISSWDVIRTPGNSDMSEDEVVIDGLNEWHVSRLPAFVNAEDHEWDSFRLKEAIYILESLSLITIAEQDDASGITMHPVAHAWAKDRQKQEAKEKSWIAAGAIVSLSARSYTSRGAVERYVQPHIQSYVDGKIGGSISCGNKKNMLALLWSCGWMLCTMRDDLRLERLLQELFQEAGLDPAQVQPSALPLYHLLTMNQFDSGYFKMSADLMEQVVGIRRGTLDEAHPDRLEAEHLLARYFLGTGQVEDAVKLFKHVIRIKETTLAERHIDRLTLEHELAGAYLKTGEIAEAVRLLKHIVKIKEMILSEKHPDRLVSEHELGRAYLQNGQIAEAVRLLKYVVRIKETTLAEKHPDRLASEHTLAVAYSELGEITEAIQLLKHVVKIRETTLAETDSRLVSSRRLLSKALNLLSPHSD
jgi:tetratricopeptide (TPR) repeat protein